LNVRGIPPDLAIPSSVILSAAKDLRSARREILRCAQDDNISLWMTARRPG